MINDDTVDERMYELCMLLKSNSWFWAAIVAEPRYEPRALMGLWDVRWY